MSLVSDRCLACANELAAHCNIDPSSDKSSAEYQFVAEFDLFYGRPNCEATEDAMPGMVSITMDGEICYHAGSEDGADVYAKISCSDEQGGTLVDLYYSSDCSFWHKRKVHSGDLTSELAGCNSAGGA